MRQNSEGFITELEDNEVFVFGSNLQGLHYGGAARTAHEKFGAVMGCGVGLQGQSYAIPTMDSLEQTRIYIVQFVRFARLTPHLTYYLTPIGQGIAGFTCEEIENILPELPENVTRVGWANTLKEIES